MSSRYPSRPALRCTAAAGHRRGERRKKTSRGRRRRGSLDVILKERSCETNRRRRRCRHRRPFRDSERVLPSSRRVRLRSASWSSTSQLATKKMLCATVSDEPQPTSTHHAPQGAGRLRADRSLPPAAPCRAGGPDPTARARPQHRGVATSGASQPDLTPTPTTSTRELTLTCWSTRRPASC